MRRLLLILLALLLLTGAVYAAPEDASAEEASPEETLETAPIQLPEETLPPEPTEAQIPASDVTATDMDTVCTVAGDGSCRIDLTVYLEFSKPVSSFSIPIAKQARDVQLTGADFKLHQAEKYALVEAEGSFSGQVKLTLSYRLAETVTDTGESQTFRVTLLHPAWVCPIKAYRFTLRMPKPFEGLPAILSGYYGDLIDNYMDVQIDDGVVSAQLNTTQYLVDHEAMSVELTLPSGYFDLRFLAGKTAKVDRLMFLFLLVLAAVYWTVFLRGRVLLPRRQTMPPEGSNPGEIPYLLTGGRADLAQMVVHWATLGYLTIHRSRRGAIFLTRQIDMGTERKQHEIALFRALFKRGDRCDVRSESYLHARQTATARILEHWGPRIFAKKSGSRALFRFLAAAAGMCLCLACLDVAVAPRSWRWFLIVPLSLLGGVACWCLQRAGGCLLRRHGLRTIVICLVSAASLFVIGSKGGSGRLMFLCVLFQLLVGFLVRCGGRRTREGASLAADLLGYRRYLLSSSSGTLRGNLRSDPQYFYKVLPYADALQVGSLFAGAFDRTRIEPCDWLDWEGKPMKTAPGFYRRYRRLMAGLRGEPDPTRWRKRMIRR